MTYEYTRLLVTEFRDCFRFYRDAMGFEVEFGDEDGTYAEFALGDVGIALFDRDEMSDALGTSRLPSTSQAQDRFCLVFAVENVDATCEKLKSAGVPIAAPPTDHKDWGIRTAHLRDPEGNLIEVYHPLAS